MKATWNQNPMNCEEVLHLLPLYVGGELETDQRGNPVEQIRAHVEGCVHCALELERGSRLVQVRQEYWQSQLGAESPGDVHAQAGPDLRSAVLARLQTEGSGQVLEMSTHSQTASSRVGSGVSTPVRAGSWAPMAAAAALLLAAVGLGSQFMGASNGVQSDGRMVTPTPNSTPVAQQQNPQPQNPNVPAGQQGPGSSLFLAGADEGTAPSPAAGGLRRIDPKTKSLLEEARPWGLEETPAGGMEFGRGAMKMATHEGGQ